MKLNFNLNKLVYKLVLFIIYIAGICFWIYFFNGGSITFLSNDWSKEYTYYSILKQALITHTIPYNISQQIQGTDRFLANPETNIFPSILLLPFLSIGKFILLHILIMYSFGYFGCLMLLRKYNLSLLPFLFLFSLYNFNGYIISHLSAGHSMWSGYFLLSIFFYLVFEMIEKDGNSFTSIKLAFILVIILTAGAVHLYIFCLMLLFLIAILNWKYTKSFIYSIGLSLILGLYRLAPAFFAFKNYKPSCKSGFNTPINFITALIAIKPITTFRVVNSFTIGCWEYDIYISIIGVLFLLTFGIYFSFRNYKDFNQSFKVLLIPLIIIFILSIDNVYGFVTSFLFSILQFERMPTRFIIIPLVFLFIISSIQMQNVLNSSNNKRIMVMFFYVFFIMLGTLLIEHSIVWQLKPLEKYLINNNPYLSKVRIINVHDILYKNFIQISFIISFISLIIAFFHLINAYIKSKPLHPDISIL